MSAALATMARILALAADRNVDVNEFLAAIAAEPGLADEIVRVANSPRYGMQGKLTRLDRVALILGVRPVAEIAAGALLARRAAPEAEDPQRRSPANVPPEPAGTRRIGGRSTPPGMDSRLDLVYP
jgi:HD-like signal output (HDOD) protein